MRTIYFIKSKYPQKGFNKKLSFNALNDINFTNHSLSVTPDISGDHEGGPDGMDFDEDGFLLVANWGSGHVEVFPPTGGVPSTRIRCPFDRVSNVHFRPNSNEVFVTEHDNHALWSFEWRTKGRKEYCQT